jgi:uncharacterized protein DUF4846
MRFRPFLDSSLAWVRSRRSRPLASLALGLTLLAFLPGRAAGVYPWLERYDPQQSVEARISPPSGFTRVEVRPGSFGEWLRGLPLKPGRPPVHLFDGRLKVNQEAHFAVLDMDVGPNDLQQCADAVMRLRAEYLFAAGRKQDIAFRFTNDDRVDFLRWSEGWRPAVHGERVSWTRSAAPSAAYSSLRSYLQKVFEYAGSASLSRELLRVAEVERIEPGDVFIHGGFPGHAVIVLDVAEREGGKRFLLAQSYMPAQEMHVLRNPAGDPADPWFDTKFGDRLETPEWTFAQGELKRFE